MTVLEEEVEAQVRPLGSGFIVPGPHKLSWLYSLDKCGLKATSRCRVFFGGLGAALLSLKRGGEKLCNPVTAPATSPTCLIILLALVLIHEPLVLTHNNERPWHCGDPNKWMRPGGVLR